MHATTQTALDALDDRLAAAGWTCSMVLHYRAQRARGASPAVAREVTLAFAYERMVGSTTRLVRC